MDMKKQLLNEYSKLPIAQAGLHLGVQDHINTNTQWLVDLHAEYDNFPEQDPVVITVAE